MGITGLPDEGDGRRPHKPLHPRAGGARPEGGEVDLVQLLQRTELFEGLTREELQGVAQLMRRRRYRRGMFIFLEGEPVEAVYFIDSGSVKASTSGPDGREHILSVLGPGDFFPHVGFLDGGPAPATAEALEETVLWAIRRDDFYRLLTHHAALAVRMVAILGGRIRRLQLQVRDLATQSVPARLAQALIFLCRQHGEPAEEADATGAVRIGVQLSHHELAALVGTTRESVSRILSAFRRAGLVATRQGHLVVLDPEGLREWC